MKMKKFLVALLALTMLLSLTACGEKGTPVYVQSVRDIVGMGSIALGDKFPGMVVSENVTEIQKDGDKTIAEIFVKEGDDVSCGQELFSYDFDELQLNLDRQNLELEQMNTQLESYSEQIAQLEKEKKSASKSDQLQYTVQIQTLQADQKETEYNIKVKQAEIARSEALMGNVTVVSPVDGRIQAISENGTDNYGNPLPYITIQQTGTYRVKGTIGELQLGSLMVGMRLRILSRTDPNQFWLGTVSLVDYENPTQGNSNDMYFGNSVDPMTSASKYPFYVELDSADGLILGQHVYLEADTGDGVAIGLQLPSYFVCSDDFGGSFVWAESGSGKLEKRTVTLGSFDEMMGTYEILNGLTVEDYIAVPDENLCKAGAPTTHDYVEPDDLPGGDPPMNDFPMDGEKGNDYDFPEAGGEIEDAGYGDMENTPVEDGTGEEKQVGDDATDGQGG